MGLEDTLQVGTSVVLLSQNKNPDGSVPTGLFQPSDVLTWKLWQGSSLAPVLTKTSTTSSDIYWVSTTNAQWAVALHPSDTAALTPGRYYQEATATRGVDAGQLLPAGTTLLLTSAAGTGVVRPTYITAGDLQRLAPWIFDVQAAADETGYLDQCADARAWLDENILRNYPGGYVSLLGEHGTALAAWATSGAQRSSIRNPWLLEILQSGPAVANTNGGLIVTDRTRDICAYHALYRICDSIITKGGQYAALSARYRQQCYQLFVSYTAEINIGGKVDQWGNLLAMIPINFGTARTLRI